MRNSLLIVTCLFYLNAISQNVGDIIITEIMLDPDTVSDANGEYFEVFNTTGTDINFNNWVIKDEGSNTHLIASDEPVVIAANSYFVFGRNGDSSQNGGYEPDYVYSSFQLTNSDDAIILINPSDMVIDAVVYNEITFPNPTGASMEFSGQSAAENDNGANWKTSTSMFGVGDFGTPDQMNSNGQMNSNVPVLSINDNNNKINKSIIYPNPTSQDFVTITAEITANATVYIYDALGQIIQETVLNNTILNTSALSPGLYFVTLQDNNHLSTTRLLVK